MQNKQFWAIALFVLLNVAAIAWGGTYWLRSRIDEWQRIQSTLRLQENRFALKEQRFSALPENNALLEEAHLAAETEGLVVLPYPLLADALDSLRRAGTVSGLQETSFYTGEIVRLDAVSNDDQTVMAFNGTIACEGFFDEMVVFLETIIKDEMYCRFNRFVIESEKGIVNDALGYSARITLDFVFYGREERK